ncbi:MAG: asparagine synthetase B, partial [Gammaproteobacteria bacterium]|nr:asparagine synthetase B [Gammaproteobacteria bacterium]
MNDSSRSRAGRCLARTTLLAALLLAPAALPAQHLLVPMDHDQDDHLKAYGLTYWSLERGATAEWLLNYRDGAFLLPDRQDVRREAAFRGVSIEPVSAADVAAIRALIARSNMESVILEQAPSV